MRDRGPLPFVALAVVIAVGAGVWLLFIRDDESSDSANGAGGADAPRIVDEDALGEIAAAVGHEVYWAGPIDATQLELTSTSEGRVYVRYLPADAEAGDPRAEFLTVGTYPVDDPLETLEEASSAPRFTRIDLGGGGVATYDERQPSSIHLAYPGSDLEIEVYDPSPQRALELVTQGNLEAVD